MRSFRASLLLLSVFLVASSAPGQTTTQIHGLTAKSPLVAGDEFIVDTDVAGVFRSRKVLASTVEAYFEAATLVFTGAAILDANAALKLIVPSGAIPTATACDEAGEEDGRVFVDTDVGIPQLCLCNGTAGWVCGAIFGSSIDDTELTAEDFGDFTCSGAEDGCTIDSGVVTSAKILDDTILEVDLKSVNASTDEYCLTKEDTTGDFEWQVCGTGAGGTNTQVQFNSANALAGDAGFTYNSATDSVTLVGTVAAGTVTGANVTSGADPGHTHTGGAVSTDIILEGDSNVEVIDAGTGQVDFDVDGANRARMLAGSFTLGIDLLIDNQKELRLGEPDAAGTEYIALKAPATIAANRICTLEDDANPIPDSCVGDGTDGGGAPGGSDTQVQFNDGGSTFGGDAGFVYNKTTDSATLAGTIAAAGGTFTSTVNVDDEQELRFFEEDAGGSNYKGFKAPAAITANTTCTFEDDANFIPDSCVGDGTDGGGTKPPREWVWSGAGLLALEHAADAIAPVALDQGTNVDVLVRQHDDTTDECVGGVIILPADADTAGTVTFTAVWYSGTATTGNIMWDIRHSGGQAEGVTWNTALTTVAAAADATQGTVDQLTVTSWTVTMSTAAWAVSDTVDFELCRDANHASDTLVGDASLLAFRLSVPRA